MTGRKERIKFHLKGVVMISITLTWCTFKWAGLVLAVLAVVGLCTGSLPDHDGSMFGNVLRWISWPLLAIWLIVFFVRALIMM